MSTAAKEFRFHLCVLLLAVGSVDVAGLCGYLQRLWGFLKRHSGHLREEPHRCCWVSRLLGEQDDDMMEAAKALLSIFLHYRYQPLPTGAGTQTSMEAFMLSKVVK